MGRHAQPEIRERLLQACTDHVLAHGLPTGLAPLAAGVGSSARMLVYHFRTRDGLLREVVGQARRRQRAVFGDALEPRAEPYAQTLARAWTVLTGPEGAPYLRLFSQVHGTGVDALWPEFRQAATTDWLDVLERGLRADGLPPERAAPLATAVLAVVRGLLLDRDATGDRARTDAGLASFTALLPAAAQPSASSTSRAAR